MKLKLAPKQLSNAYYALRHGQSLANVQNLIISHPDNGINDFGLSETGKAQVETSVSAWARKPVCNPDPIRNPDPALEQDLGRDTLIVSSDFLRTRHTAEISARVLGLTTPPIFTPLLRERFFGTWEKTGGENYDRVWADDLRQTIDPGTGVEPAATVLERALACLAELESTHSSRNILLVSHGDTLQILMTFFKGWPPHRHRELPHLETAEIRKLS